MRKFLRKAFGIFPGEEKKVFSFIKLATIWAIGSCIAETLAISLFAEKIGSEHLPSTYILTSFAMISVSCIYIYFLRYISPYKLMIITMLTASVVYICITLALLGSPPRWFWIFLQIFSNCFGSALIACFWIFLDQYHDLQDAKRIYGVYNSAYFLGFIISGSLISWTYKYVGPSTLFFIVVLTMIHSIFEARKISKSTLAMEDDGTEDFFSGGKTSIINVISEFFKSPFAVSLVAMSLIIQLLRTTTVFEYVGTLEKVFVSHQTLATKNAIPEFLGKCKAIISFGNIIVGMFFYRNFVKRAGISNLLILPPLYFIALYSDWLLYDTIFIAILAIIAVEGILFTLEDNNFNLLIKASPANLKGPLRIINDSFFEPIGMLLSSIFLIVMRHHSKLFAFSLSIIFLVLSTIVRNLYPKSIFTSLKLNAIHFERNARDWIKRLAKKEQKESKKALFKSLTSLDDEKKILAIKTLLSLEDKDLLEKILFHINNLSSDKKIQVLEILEDSIFYNDPKVIEQVNYYSEFETNELLSKTSKIYLAKRGLIHPEKVIHDLDSQDLLCRVSAIIALKHSKANQDLHQTSFNRTIAIKETELLFKFDEINEICMGLDILSYDESDEAAQKAFGYISHENIIIKRKASEALARIIDKADSRYAFKIIDELKHSSDNIFRKNLIIALGNINDSTTVKDILESSINFRPNEKRLVEKIILNMGLKIVPILISIIKDPTLNERCRILAGKILGKLSIAQLQKNVEDVIKKEIEKAHFYFYFGNTIEKKYPLYDLFLLKNALLSGYKSKIDFIIHLLGAASPMEDVDLIVKSMHSKNAKTNAQAFETLEKNIPRHIFSKIRSLIDDIPLDYKLEASEIHLENVDITLKELLDMMEKSHLFFDKIIAAYLKAKMRLPDWKQSIREQIKTSDESFHQFAYELLEL